MPATPAPATSSPACSSHLDGGRYGDGMSGYGPSGDPPGPRPPGEDPGPPSDPWGQAAPGWGGQTVGYPQQPYQEPGLGFGQGWDSPPPQRRNLPLYALVAVLVVLAAAGVGYALYLLTGGGDEEPEARDTPRATSTTQPTGTPDPEGSPRENIGMSAAMAQVDDCLVNDGTAEQPQMRIVACDTEEGGQVFRVLAIFPEQVEGEGQQANEQAQAICADTEGYTHHYYEVGESASFVLCMAERG